MRLTDLLIDGAIDTETHKERREAAQRELARLSEERADVTELADSQELRRQFFERTQSLIELYEIAKPDEKRQIVENCTSNRSWNGENLCLQPQDWLDVLLSDNPVPDGGPFWTTFRTFMEMLDRLTPSQCKKNETWQENFRRTSEDGTDAG